MREICPGNCERCPLIDEMLKEAERVDKLRSGLLKGAMSPEVDEIATHVFDFMQRRTEGEFRGVYSEESIGIENPEDLASKMRMGISDFTQKLDSTEASIKKEVDFLTQDCDGPITMRAKHAGKIVTARICMSPVSPEEETDGTASIKRIKEN